MSRMLHSQSLSLSLSSWWEPMNLRTDSSQKSVCARGYGVVGSSHGVVAVVNKWRQWGRFWGERSAVMQRFKSKKGRSSSKESIDGTRSFTPTRKFNCHHPLLQSSNSSTACTWQKPISVHQHGKLNQQYGSAVIVLSCNAYARVSQ